MVHSQVWLRGFTLSLFNFRCHPVLRTPPWGRALVIGPTEATAEKGGAPAACLRQRSQIQKDYRNIIILRKIKMEKPTRVFWLRVLRASCCLCIKMLHIYGFLQCGKVYQLILLLFSPSFKKEVSRRAAFPRPLDLPWPILLLSTGRGLRRCSKA